MIAHVDADSFFASVLVRKHPSLRGKAVLALGMGGTCIIAATYEAKAKGVKTGMRLIDARKLVPGAIEMPSDFRETALASHQIESVLRDHCPVIEQMSIDEWFLDLPSMAGGIPSNLESWAKEVREIILQKTAISVSVGIAPTKTLAKMASEYRKPGGITVVSISDSDQAAHSTFYILNSTFLAHRPAAAIPGIGPRRQIETEAHGWKTAWDFARAPDDLLRPLFGRPGLELKRELNGERVYLIQKDDHPPKSISRCRSFRGTNNPDLVKAHLLKHLEYCVTKMRHHGLATTEVAVWVRDKTYAPHGNHVRLSKAAHTTDDLLHPSLTCLMTLLHPGESWNQVGLALGNLMPDDSLQQSLFDDPKDIDAGEKLQTAMDDIHRRFGRDAVTRGSALSVRSGTVKEMDMPIIG